MSQPKRPFSPTLLWLSIGFFFMFAGASQQQFQSPFWSEALHWPPVLRSFILAVVYLTFGFWRLRIGWFIRRWGEKTVLLLGSSTYALFCLVVWQSTSFPVLLLAAAIWGWGGAANWGTSSVMVLDATRDQRYGTSTGLFQAASSIGFALGVVLLSRVYEAAQQLGPLGPRVVWLYAAISTIIGVLCLLRVPAREVEIDPPSLREQIAIMTSPKGAIGCVFLFLGGFGFGAMLGVLADNLATAFPGGNRNYVAAFFPLAGFFANLFGGPLSDRIGRARAMFGTFTLAGVGLLLAWALPQSLTAMVVCALFLGFQSQLVPTLTTAMIGDSTHASRRQNVYGALFFWRDMGVAGALVFGQWLHQLKDIRSSLLAMAILTGSCAALSLVLSKRAEEAM
ncbi:MAG: MFS transporter [Armatimonadetes bacterium]|nr:MFS transporter [Armatimonadota bacterium]